MDADPVLAIELLAEERALFRAPAYFFVLRAIEHTQERLGRKGHVSGQELLEGVRELALADFGPMAFEVFRYWGLRRSEDIGRIVFDLVESDLLGKTENDCLADFEHGFDFEQALVTEYPW